MAPVRRVVLGEALFVCTANKIRSPIAEYLLREALDLARSLGLQRVFADTHPALGDWVRQVTGDSTANATATGALAAPMRAPRKAWVSPEGMKQMSWLSGFSATESPRLAASSRIAGLGVSPTGNAA